MQKPEDQDAIEDKKSASCDPKDEGRRFAEAILGSIRQPLLLLNGNLRVETANRAFFQTFEVDEASTEGRLVYELGNGQWNIPQLRQLLEETLPVKGSVDDYRVEHVFEPIGRRVMLLNAHRMERADQSEAILLAIEDQTTVRRISQTSGALASQGCVILDFGLPGISGQLVQERLSAGATNLEVMVVTGRHEVSLAVQAVQAVQAGAVDFLVKPFDGDRLLEAVDRALKSAATNSTAAQQSETDAFEVTRFARLSPKSAGQPSSGQSSAVLGRFRSSCSAGAKRSAERHLKQCYADRKRG